MVWQAGRAYSSDPRARVLSAEGSARAVSERFGVSVSYVVKARRRQDRTGGTAAREARRTWVRRLAGYAQPLGAEVGRRNNATLAERGVLLGITALCVR
jgi:transposase